MIVTPHSFDWSGGDIVKQPFAKKRILLARSSATSYANVEWNNYPLSNISGSNEFQKFEWMPKYWVVTRHIKVM